MRSRWGENIFIGGLMLFIIAVFLLGVKAITVLFRQHGVIGSVVLVAILGIVLMILGMYLDVRSVP